MDAAAVSFFQDLVRKLGRSLIQYVSESFPWTTVKNEGALPVIFDLAREERDAAAAIVKLLLKHRARPPYLGAYPTSFTTINYMAIDFLLPYLIDTQKRRIADVERDLALVTDEESRQALNTILEMTKRHLAALTALVTAEKPAA